MLQIFFGHYFDTWVNSVQSVVAETDARDSSIQMNIYTNVVDIVCLSSGEPWKLKSLLLKTEVYLQTRNRSELSEEQTSRCLDIWYDKVTTKLSENIKSTFRLDCECYHFCLLRFSDVQMTILSYANKYRLHGPYFHDFKVITVTVLSDTLPKLAWRIIT